MSKRLVIALGTLTSLGLLALVLAQLDLARVHAQLAAARPRLLLAALGLAALVLLARGARFWALCQRSDLRQVIAAIAVQNFLTRVTPLRLGELSLPYTLQRIAGEPAAPALIALALVRLVEIWVLGIFALGGAAWVFSAGGARLAPLWWVIGLSSLALLSFRAWAALAARLLLAAARRLGLAPEGWQRRALNALLDALQVGARYGLRAWSALIGGTVVVMSAQFALFGALIAACGINVSPAQLIVGVSGAAIASALPLFTVGSIGALEAGWVGAFMWVGLGIDEAALTGVFAQLATLLFAALFAAPAFAWLTRAAR
ncbi:flippase-like domain-containing protein [Myxococcota bacterium]|nr:flippase-like domain-containing protein [Myxococcota bacterium]MBU1432758.1 flippase-like domain-containing protein [Myxococcota bacterium]MBU1896222.1 flippase-like domain-containing protein [Myxococcota bacterium]